METSSPNKKLKLDTKELIQIIDQLKYRIADLEKPESRLKFPASEVNHKSKSKFDFSKCKFRHIALRFLYLGWNFDGLVVQEGKNNTIEKHLFDALLKACLIEDRKKSNYHRCGRTDIGVSSFSQVISLTVRSRLENNQTDDEELPYCRILNALLPKEIRIIAWAPVSSNFSARFDCKKRVYKYWFPLGDLNIEKMRQAAQSLIGCHNFSNLCKMDLSNGVPNFERLIFEADVSIFNSKITPPNSAPNAYTMCELVIIGKGFLWHQIRCIVTILFLVGQGKENPDIVNKLLNTDECPKKPTYGLSNPLPLNLYDCSYDEVPWKTDCEELKKVKKVLQSFWTTSAVKCTMLESMLNDLSKINGNESAKNDSTYVTLFNDMRSKIYQPLLYRPTEDGLEDRISRMKKKGKWKFNDE